MQQAVLGVDGCPGGWVGVLVCGRTLSWHAGPFGDLLALPAAVVAVDVPMGLPEGAARREADLLARRLLGAQRSSVFLAPPRAVLDAENHAQSSALARTAGSAGVSLQTWHLVPRIREVDLALQRDPRLRERVVEVHPELSLRRLAEECAKPDDPPAGPPRPSPAPTTHGLLPERPAAGRHTPVRLPPKRTAAGRLARLAVLRNWQPDAAVPVPRPGRAAADDCLDALACAWSGLRWLRGHADVLGGQPDRHGIPMRIVV